MTKPSRAGCSARARTLRSFAVLLSSFGIAGGAWTWARRQPAIDGLPAPFRQALEWNGRLGAAIFNPARMNRSDPPPPGKRPRVNGDIGLKTPVDPLKWRMEIEIDEDPAGREPFSVNLSEVKLLPRADTGSRFYCIEGWSEAIAYGGVRFSDFLEAYGLPKDYAYVGLETPDGEYYVSIDMESMLHPQTLLAYEMNGAPLSPENGAPLRLIIPVKYGIKSLKRIGRIFFSNERPPDYWAEEGYDWSAGL